MPTLPYAAAVLAIFIATVAAMRLLGKSAIIQLTPYDLATIILLGTILAEPLVGPSMERALFAAALIIAAHLLFARLTLTPWGGRWLLGEPTILVKHGKIVENNLESSGVSIAQLLALLRSAGHPRVEDVEYAILEPIGQLSVIPKAEAAPVTPRDLSLPQRYQG
ncbi:MAG TPA: YetF domain-containing protein, partial [Bacillota bacterium]